MKNDNLNSILSDLAENAGPAAQIDLWPGLKKSLTASDGASKHGKSILIRTRILRQAAFGALVVLVAFAILLVTPPGRTLAQELLKYFTTTSQRSIPPVPTPVLVPTYTLAAGLLPQPTISTDSQDCGEALSPISSTFVCQLQDAQAQLGFAVKSFPTRYVQAHFYFMMIDQEQQALYMSFHDQQAFYILAQGLGDFPKSSPVYQEAVQLVQVGEYQAEYAAGTFIIPENEGMVWEADASVYRLRWKEDEHWYSFTLSVDPPGGMEPAETQAIMIQIAENLVSLDQGVDQLTGGSQPSIQDSAGFTIKKPSLLPEGFQQVSDGRWSNLTTSPRVGMRYDYVVNGQWVNSLTLDQMPISADDQTLRREYGLLYQNQALVNGQWVNPSTDEEVQIKGGAGYYLDGGESFTNALYWRDDEREYLLIYHWAPDFGGRLDQESLIAIAESLK